MTSSGRLRIGRRDDEGSAIVEFCVLAVLMLVPVVYLVVTLGRVQAGAFAAQGGAREAARAYVTAADEQSAAGRAQAAAAVAFSDQGFDDPALVGVEIGCRATPCLRPEGQVAARTHVQVVLPLVPRLIDRIVPTRIEVSAEHVATVDRFRAR